LLKEQRMFRKSTPQIGSVRAVERPLAEIGAP
jgi:hypothetical protein